MPLVTSSKYFKPHELECKCGCGDGYMDADFMALMDAIREEIDIPLNPSSAYRCPDHNNNVSSTGRTGPHTTRCAMDIRISGGNAHKLILIALNHGITGLGVSQKGAHNKRFIHLDNLFISNRPWVWSY